MAETDHVILGKIVGPGSYYSYNTSYVNVVSNDSVTITLPEGIRHAPSSWYPVDEEKKKPEPFEQLTLGLD